MIKLNIIQMSISAGFLILATLFCRWLSDNKLIPNASLAMWKVAIIRLLVPFSVITSMSVYGIFQRINELDDSVHVMPITDLTTLSDDFTQISDASIAPSQAIPWLTIIWGIGFLVLTVRFIRGYLKNHRLVTQSSPVNSPFLKAWQAKHPLWRVYRIRQSDQIFSPVTTGIIFPDIILPEQIDLSDEHLMNHILEHEYSHIRRLDALWKLLLYLALCLHWFNPLVWGMYYLFNRDLEIACDQMTVKSLGNEERKAYASSLLSMTEQNSPFLSLNNYFARSATEARIMSILKHKRPSREAIIGAAILVALTTSMFATSAAESPRPDWEEQMEEYEPFGMTTDGNIFYFDGKIVREFHDPQADFATMPDYLDESCVVSANGSTCYSGPFGDPFTGDTANYFLTGYKDYSMTVDVIPVRNEEGKLIDLTAADKEAFDRKTDTIEVHIEELQNDYKASTVEEYGSLLDEDDDDHMDFLSQYTSYGISYDESEKCWKYGDKYIRAFYDNYYISANDNRYTYHPDSVVLKAIRTDYGKLKEITEYVDD